MRLDEMEMRAVYAAVLNELMDSNPNVYCIEADLGKASGTNPAVAQAHPGNYVNVGVSEANMVGVAAGLAAQGKIPFCASFSCFASRRVYDQVTISVAYAGSNVKIVGTAPGITAGPNGGTHMCFQDLAIMRAMPKMQVFSPCDAWELRAVVTVENQSILGGLGGAVCETLSERCPTRVRRLGVPDAFGEVATESYLVASPCRRRAWRGWSTTPTCCAWASPW